jgi:hypothetical protein
VLPQDLNDIPVGVLDPEQWYLEHLVPQRVVMDATYLDLPTVAATIRVLVDTAGHLIHSGAKRSREVKRPLTAGPNRKYLMRLVLYSLSRTSKWSNRS